MNSARKKVWLLCIISVVIICTIYWQRNAISHAGSISSAQFHFKDTASSAARKILKWRESATTASGFIGDKTRVFPKSDVKFKSHHVKLRSWCVLVVLDKHSTPAYDTGWTEGEGSKSVVILTPTDQDNLRNEFVDMLPWNSFGRKNTGFLYAIAHGAEVIWDFDDDNALKFWLTDAAPPNAPSLDAMIPESGDDIVQVYEPRNHAWPTYNPYPSLHAPTLPSWPRGLPLDDIKVSNCSDTPLKIGSLKSSSIGVLQSLADYEPDVDAIYRLTMPIPFYFERVSETKHLMVPPRSFTPYNAQATLHFKASFFSMYLPVSVNGRVSDIWRSYISERLFWDVGLRVGFMARPIVVQNRNVHSNIADLMAENHLYTRAKQMIEFLQSWKGSGMSVVARMEELWIALYERNYIELEDVHLIQSWLQSLINIGYDFPPLVAEENIPIPVYPSTVDMKEDGNEREKCIFNKKLTLWTSDLDGRSRLDFPSLLASEGMNVILGGCKLDKTPYPAAFKTERITVHRNLSKIILQKFTHSTQLTESMVRENFKFFKDNPVFPSVDVFLCQFPASMCELWMPFNKTIAYVPAHRYNLGRCTKEEWDRLDQHLMKLSTMSSPKHIIGASSYYDQEYFRHYTGLDPLPLHSLCASYTKPSEHPYNPTKDEILFVSHLGKGNVELLLEKIHKFKIVDVVSLYKHFTSKDLMSHRGLVYIPYSVMSYKLCEFYSLGIPLFFPSVKFFRTIQKFGTDRNSVSDSYCKNPKLNNQMKPHPKSLHPYSPNVDGSEDQEAESYWLQMSDFYHWPHITYFDDMNDLEKKLSAANFQGIHDLMMKEVRHKETSVKETWCRALKNTETGRQVPQNYQDAIKELYGAERLQVH